MNVLILTSERTGSTLLQRVLTVYMQQGNFDKPVVQLHNLVHGVRQYYNQNLKQILLAPNKDKNLQSFNDISSLLATTNQYTVARTNYRTFNKRNDSIEDRLNFYNYLNKNFYIIKCGRKNLFEWALSWCIYEHSKIFNVYSNHERFKEIYENEIVISKETLITRLNQYTEYNKWVDANFKVQSYFNYEDSFNNLEDYISTLDFMKEDNITWEDMFGQTFNEWNFCHYLIGTSDIIKSSSEKYSLIDKENIQLWNNLKGCEWPALTNDVHNQIEKLPDNIKDEIFNLVDISSIITKELSVSKEIADFLDIHIPFYSASCSKIKTLVNSQILTGDIPIKLHTFSDKKKIIENFSQCTEWYNEWALKNGYFTVNEYTNKIPTDIELSSLPHLR